jgi:hypothetical protein
MAVLLELRARVSGISIGPFNDDCGREGNQKTSNNTENNYLTTETQRTQRKKRELKAKMGSL